MQPQFARNVQRTSAKRLQRIMLPDLNAATSTECVRGVKRRREREREGGLATHAQTQLARSLGSGCEYPLNVCHMSVCICVRISISFFVCICIWICISICSFIHIAIALDYAYEQTRKFLITRENTRNVTNVEFSACGQARNMREARKKKRWASTKDFNVDAKSRRIWITPHKRMLFVLIMARLAMWYLIIDCSASIVSQNRLQFI